MLSLKSKTFVLIIVQYVHRRGQAKLEEDPPPPLQENKIHCIRFAVDNAPLTSSELEGC